jgi:hypothetical protein
LDSLEAVVKAPLLQDEFAPRAVRPAADLLLLRPGDALALVDRASDEGVPIVRIDGFRVTGGATEAPGEHTVDFSDAVRHGHGCWDTAEAFIRARSELGLVFEITLGDDPVEAV